MAWCPFDPVGAVLPGEGLPFWHIISGEVIVVPTRREYALHGQLLLEGELRLQGTARVRIEK